MFDDDDYLFSWVIAVAMGAIAQFRVMGGCIGISILTAVANGYLQSHLKHSLDAAQMQSILHCGGTFRFTAG